jgi:predicted transcriptional regulator
LITYCSRCERLKPRFARLVLERAPGPSPSFSVFHLIKALELIAENPIGRNKLSRELRLGEGVTRTLIERLKKHGLILVRKNGCVLSKKGKEYWRSLQAVFPASVVLKKSGLTLGRFNAALIVKGYGRNVRRGMEQRDAALMAGADGATTLVFKDSKLTIPPGNQDIAESYPRIHARLVRSLAPQENDAIVIGCADTLRMAEYGAWAAGWSLIDA